jgi:phosphate starvation-inducible PhoH-like protein
VAREDEAAPLKDLLTRLVRQAKEGKVVTPEMVQLEISQIAGPSESKASRLAACGLRPDEGDELAIRTPRLTVYPKTPHQADYVRAIEQNDIVIAIGPAGTGKTYLAVGKAVAALTSGKVARIILTRPAVEAGESLGYLPGGFREKVDPYLRPLYDALYDMIPLERMKRLVDEQVVEVAPLAYMRGRTLSDSFVILDEAQNTTSAQMKMFLTRLGWNSKAVVTGDITQIDLDPRQRSGLVEVQHRLRRIPGIQVNYFDNSDVVRPPLVAAIIRAYEEDREKPGPNAEGSTTTRIGH